MIKFETEDGKVHWSGVTEDDEFSDELFNEIDYCSGQNQWVFHTNIGSITIVDRETGFGGRDTETGFRDVDGNFWLASCNFDIRYAYDFTTKSVSKTVGQAIELIKRSANTCRPDFDLGEE